MQKIISANIYGTVSNIDKHTILEGDCACSSNIISKAKIRMNAPERIIIQECDCACSNNMISEAKISMSGNEIITIKPYDCACTD